jgi:hypothetical protein
MVHGIPTTTLPDPTIRLTQLLRRVAAVQATYFLLTGLWSLFGTNSFQAVTGAKTDLWLVYMVGCLVMVIGIALLTGVVSGRITRETIVLALGTSNVLAAIDLVFVFRGVISWVYLLDALAQGGLIAWWVYSYASRPKPFAIKQYAQVERLLNRGRSVVEPGQPIA